MSLQTINLGNYANDGTGDDLRTAFQKVNENFLFLNTEASVVNATNLGTVVMTGGNNLGTTITVSSTTGLIRGSVVSVTSGTGSFASNTTVIQVTSPTTFTVSAQPNVALSNATIRAAGAGVFAQRNGSSFEYKTLISSNRSILISETAKSIDLISNAKLVDDVSPQLGGNLNLGNFAITGGDVQTTVYGIDVPTLFNLVKFMLQSSQVDVDLGAFFEPPEGTLEMGSFAGPYYDQDLLDFGEF